MGRQVVTANRLRDGIVVYLSADEGWSERLSESRVAADGEQAETLMALADEGVATQRVIAPYLIEIKDGDGVLTPVRYREVIRSRGPSNRTDVGKQAGGGG